MSGAGRLRVHLGGGLHGGSRCCLGVDGTSRLLEAVVIFMRWFFGAIWDWMNRHPFPHPAEPTTDRDSDIVREARRILEEAR